MKKEFFSSLVFLLVIGFALAVMAQMQSGNYRLSTSVLSGGGAAMDSDTYMMETTLGQPTPLMDSGEPPSSMNYLLYPGFWYTLEVLTMPCDDLASFAESFGSVSGNPMYNYLCDSEGDGDIDGIDLARF